MHSDSHPLAGQTVTLSNAADLPFGEVVTGAQFRVEDWWDKLTGGSWQDAEGNPAALKYAMRLGANFDTPLDNEVVYGKIGPFGHLVHISEL